MSKIKIDRKSTSEQRSFERGTFESAACKTSNRLKIMAPVLPGVGKTAREVVQEYIDNNQVVIFSKTTCPFCSKVGKLNVIIVVIHCLIGNVELNWPKLFQAFSVKFTLIFYHECVHSIIPHQHM